MKQIQTIFILTILLVTLLVGQVLRPTKDSIDYVIDYEEDYLTDRPIIGVVSQPIPKDFADNPKLIGKTSYIEASYVRWLQSAGARVVPILYHGDRERNLEALSHLNGLLFPGGFDQEDEFIKFAQDLYQHVIRKNEEGMYYPVMGVCLGFEHLAMFYSSPSILTPHRSYRKNLEMRFKVRPQQTKMFASLGQKAYIYEENALAYQAHDWGISFDDFEQKLGQFYKATSVSFDDAGEEFISTFEGKDYPVYGLQFHPEKPISTHYPDVNIDHSKLSLQYNRYFADFFVEEAKKNGNSFGNFEEEQSWQIENYDEVLVNSYFDKIYAF